MKRYALFGGETFYARGGFNDLIGTEDTSDKALTTAQQLIEKYKDHHKHLEWVQIVDLTTGEIVWSIGQALGAWDEAANAWNLRYQSEPSPGLFPVRQNTDEDD